MMPAILIKVKFRHSSFCWPLREALQLSYCYLFVCCAVLLLWFVCRSPDLTNFSPFFLLFHVSVARPCCCCRWVSLSTYSEFIFSFPFICSHNIMLDVAAANHLHLDNTQHMRPQTLLPFTHLYTWAAVKKKKNHTHSLSRAVTCCILCSFMASVATLTHSDLYSDDVNWDLPGSFWREELQQGGGRGGEGCSSETPSADRHGFNQNGRPPQASLRWSRV